MTPRPSHDVPSQRDPELPSKVPRCRRIGSIYSAGALESSRSSTLASWTCWNRGLAGSAPRRTLDACRLCIQAGARSSQATWLPRVVCAVEAPAAVRIALFLSSYAPLFALLAYTRRCSMALWTLVAVTVISVAALIVVMLMQRNERGPVLRIAHARPKDGDVLACMAST